MNETIDDVLRKWGEKRERWYMEAMFADHSGPQSEWQSYRVVRPAPVGNYIDAEYRVLPDEEPLMIPEPSR